MFEDNYNKKGYCIKCGKYKSLNKFKKCRECIHVNKSTKRSKVVF